MTRKMRIGARGVGQDALIRLAGFNVEVLTSKPLPDFPWGFNPPIITDLGGKGDLIHDCQAERTILLPPFLVFDVITRAVGGCTFCSNKAFEPYYLQDAFVLHEGMPWPCLGQYRPFHGGEAICAVAQNPWIGSVRFATKKGSRDSAEAYIDHEGKIVVNDCGNQYHHNAFVKRSETPRFDLYREVTHPRR